MREYFTFHRSVFPSYLTIESGRMTVLEYSCKHKAWILKGYSSSHDQVVLDIRQRC